MLVFIDKNYFLLRKKMLYPTSSRSVSSDRSVRRFRDYYVLHTAYIAQTYNKFKFKLQLVWTIHTHSLPTHCTVGYCVLHSIGQSSRTHHLSQWDRTGRLKQRNVAVTRWNLPPNRLQTVDFKTSQ